MAAAYSDDLRDRILSAYDRGMRTAQIARVFEVSPAWARRVKQTRRETGRTRPLRPGGKRPPKIDRARLAQLVEAQPDATLKELRERLGVVCALSSLCTALKKMKLSFKKSRSTPRSRTGPMSPNAALNGSSGAPASTPAA